MIKDSGARRSFPSGAVRDIAEGKGRADLLPLGIIAYHTDDDILANVEKIYTDRQHKPIMASHYAIL